MRIVHLLDTSSRLAGGMFESVKGLAQSQRRLGMNISIVAGRDELSAEDRPSWGDLDLINVVSSGFADGILGRDVIATLDRLAPDLIHLHGLWGVGSRALARRSRRTTTPYVVSPRGMVDSWALRRSASKKKLSSLLWENRLLRNAAFLHALTSTEAEAIRALGLFGDLVVIPNGVTLPLAGHSKVKLAPPRKMLFLGRLHPKKGIEELLSAWASLPPKIRAEWQLIIAGRDEIGLLDELRKQAHELNLTEQVSFPGGVYGDEKNALFANASAFILPSYSEGLPMAVLEAWSHSVPVFKTAECNIPEGFAVGAAIKICTDPQKMAGVLAASLGDTDVLMQTGQAGRRLVENRFRWDSIAAEMNKHYASAVKNPLRPRPER